MAAGIRVHVEGLDKFRRALKDVDGRYPKELRKALNEVGEIVAEETARRVPVRSGDLKRSIRTRSTQKEGRVVMGGTRGVDYAGWIDFGGTIAPRGKPIHRKFEKGGRYLFPSARDRRREIRKRTQKVIDDLSRKAGLT